MLVFSLLLSLHVSTNALKAEVSHFGDVALHGHAFVSTSNRERVPREVVAALPPDLTVTRFSGRTSQPNRVAAVPRAELLELARAKQRPDLVEIAQAFRDDSVILSTLMGRRLGLVAGDQLELSSSKGRRTLRVAAVTDALGFFPVRDTYRSSKTYAIVEAASYGLIEPFAGPIGSNLLLTDSGTAAGGKERDLGQVVDRVPRPPGVHTASGAVYEADRRLETDRDFLIFDLILLLTTVLAAVGVSNQLILAVHTRRRELALLRVLGMTADQIRNMLLLEGAFVGLLGGTLAVALGVPLGFASLAALKLVSAFEVHFALPPEYVLLTILGAVAVAVLAALYPARRAANVRSAESVQYE
jgi:putative ABC transport system permease protein